MLKCKALKPFEITIIPCNLKEWLAHFTFNVSSMLIKNEYSDNNLTQTFYFFYPSSECAATSCAVKWKISVLDFNGASSIFLCCFCSNFFHKFSFSRFQLSSAMQTYGSERELAGNKKKQELWSNIYATCETHSMAKVLMLSSR